MSDENRTKDPLILVKSMGFGTNKARTFVDTAPKHRLQLRILPEEAANLIAALTPLIETKKRVKLDIFWGKKQTNDGSREFDAAFFYVKEVQVEGADNAPTQFVDKKLG